MEYFKRHKIFVLSFFIAFQINAQLKQVIQSAIKSEGVVVAREGAEHLMLSKQAFEEALPAFRSLSSSTKLAGGFNNNLKKFSQGIYSETKALIRKHGYDYLEDLAQNEFEKYLLQIKICDEILAHPSYPTLYKALCLKVGEDTLERKIIKALLFGGEFNNYCIDSTKLYKIYFSLSNTFASMEMENMMAYYNCEPAAVAEINAIAAQRKIQIDSQTCTNSEDESSDVVIGLVILGVLIYLFYKLIKFLIRLLRGSNSKT
jgi:hypothetical protein